METERQYSRIEECGVCGREFEGCPYYERGKEAPCQYYERPVDNSRMFSHFFSTKGRIGRGEYLLTAAICVVVAIVLAIVLSFWYFAITGNQGALGTEQLTSQIIGFVSTLPAAALLVLAGIKRCHDAHSPVWYAWVPAVSLFIFLGWLSAIICAAAIFFLVFQRGDEGINAYGTAPGRPYDEQLREAGVDF